MTVSKTTLSMKTLNKITLSIMTLNQTPFSIMTLILANNTHHYSIPTTLSTNTLIKKKCHVVHLSVVVLLPSVTLPSVVFPNVVEPWLCSHRIWKMPLGMDVILLQLTPFILFPFLVKNRSYKTFFSYLCDKLECFLPATINSLVQYIQVRLGGLWHN